jgi:uncharacterized membrane protein YdjX (TVP38/TMEM64 family)
MPSLYFLISILLYSVIALYIGSILCAFIALMRIHSKLDKAIHSNHFEKLQKYFIHQQKSSFVQTHGKNSRSE